MKFFIASLLIIAYKNNFKGCFAQKTDINLKIVLSIQALNNFCIVLDMTALSNKQIIYKIISYFFFVVVPANSVKCKG